LLHTPPVTTALSPLSLHDALPIWTRGTTLMNLKTCLNSLIGLNADKRPFLLDAVRNGYSGVIFQMFRCVRLTPSLTQRNIWKITDRKSTRLNSSHVSISYAVFCSK